MRTVRVKCRSRKGSTLLMAPMSKEKLNEIRGGPGGRKPVVRDLPAEEEAARQIYRDSDGRIGLPTYMLRKALVLAGTKVPLRGKVNVTRASDGATELHSFLWILDNFLVFTNIPAGSEEQKKHWQVSLVRGSQTQTKGKGGGAVAIVRPEFPQWEFTVTIHFDETRAHEDVIKRLFTEAGLTQGLGSWRPNRGGDHGQFEVVEWTDITEQAATEAA